MVMQRRCVILASTLAIAVLILIDRPAAAQTATLPELPRAGVDVTMPVQSGRIIAVSAGGDVQAALNAAVPGDTVTLAAGATYTGTFTLPLKSGSGWIVIRSSAPDSQLPAVGQRVTPAFAGAMPKLVATGVSPVLKTAPGAHHYRLIGIEIALAPTVSASYGLVTLGESSQTSLVEVPYALVLDRVYVHGTGTANLRRAVALNSASTAIVDSWLSDAHEAGADAQAIAGWNGPGPFRIENCYLEGAGENVLFGGADPAIANLVPSDITIRRNLLSKPAAWKTAAWTVKNSLELKNAQRVLIDGNVIEHNWLQSQNGYTVLLTVRNQDGGAPWSVVQDVTFTNNHVRRVSSGINILGRDNLFPSQASTRIRIANNLFTELDPAVWGGHGRLVQVLDGVSHLAIEHNTALQVSEILVASGPASTNMVFRDNIANAGGYGIGGDATFGNPALTLSTFFPGAVFTRNALIGAYAAAYPAGNAFPATVADVGFSSVSTGNYRLLATSPYRNAASDGTDLGVNVDVMAAAMAGTVAPPPPPPPPPPPDTTAPSVSLTAPAAAATVSGTVSVTAAATDDVGVAGVRFLVDGVAVGTEDTAAPYAHAWATTALADGTHTLAATARDAAGNTRTTASVTVTVKNATTVAPGTAPVGGAAVTWTRMIKTVASSTPGGLVKQGGCNGCADGGASSTLTVTAAGGYVEWTVPDVTSQRVVGLGIGDTNTSEADVDVAVKFWPGGKADLRLAGAYVGGDTAYAAGDVFRLTVQGTTVTVARNGRVLATLTATLAGPLVADTSFSTRGARIEKVTIGALGGVAPVASAGLQPVQWASPVNVQASGPDLAKSGGCVDCADAGAVSAQAIAAGGTGYLQWTMPDTTAQRVVGLGAGNSDTSEVDVDYALKFWPGGTVDVRQSGQYKTETSYAAGDVFRVAVKAGVVSFVKNGVVFHTSAVPAAAALNADTSFTTGGGRITQVGIEVTP
jgi:hypothetical protein